MSTQRGFIGIGVLLIILLGIVVLGGGAYFFVQPQSSQTASKNNTATTTTQTTPVSTTGWRLYENREIGVAFEYPESWGEVSVSREKGCQVDYYYFGTSTVKKFLSEMQRTGDPCDHVMLLLFSPSPRSGDIFLDTMTPLANEYHLGRGGYWGDVSGLINDVFMAKVCAQAGTVCAKNSRGIQVAKVPNQPSGEDGPMVTVYYIKSTHPFYYGLALSASRLNPAWEADFERVVDTLHFVSSPSTTP